MFYYNYTNKIWMVRKWFYFTVLLLILFTSNNMMVGGSIIEFISTVKPCTLKHDSMVLALYNGLSGVCVIFNRIVYKISTK